MVSLTNLLVLLFMTIIGLVFWSKTATEKKRLLHSTAILSGIAILSYYFHSISALAATDSVSPGAIKSFVTPEQQSLEEKLNLTSGDGHYSGIEYRDRTQEEKAARDESIEETIEKYASDNLIVAVTNGSVQFSGRVKDQDVARHIIEQTQAIPGVHEITFDLELDNNAM
jgi:hypothetical protein